MRLIYIPMLVFLSVFTTGAQQLFTLEQCRELALQNNKQSAIAGKMSEKSSYEVNVYRANFFPKFSASGTYLYSSAKMNETISGGYLPTFIPDEQGNRVPNIVPGTESSPVFKEYAYMPDIPLELSLSNTFTAGVQVEQPLYTGGKIRAAYRMSSIGKEMSEVNRALTRTEIILQTDEAYWSCVKARELHLAARQYKAVVTELFRNVEDAEAVGLKQKNDVLKVQVKLNDADLQLLRAENAIRLSRMNLCYIIGLPSDSPIAVSESFPESWTIESEQTADISLRPEYSLLSHQMDLKREETKLTRSDFLPQIGIRGTYNYMDGLKLNGEKMISSGNFSAVVSVSILLFEWGKGINKVKAARVEEHIAHLKRLDAEEKMTLEVAQALNALDESRFETKLTSHSLLQAEENMRISKDLYEVGMETLSDYLEAQTVWQKANTELIQARASLQYNKTKYRKAAGRL